MAQSAKLLDSLIPITLFNRGQASRIFDRLRTENRLIVLKNNQPAAVILSPQEYNRLSEMEEDYVLFLEATSRLSNDNTDHLIKMKEMLDMLKIKEEDLDDIEDVIIE